MAVIFMEGFDMYNGVGTGTGLQSKWTLTTTSDVAMTTGRFSGQAMRVTQAGASGNPRVTFASNYTSIGCGFAYKTDTLPTGNTVINMLALLNGTTFTFGLRCTSTGAIEASRATSGTGFTALGTSTPSVIVANTWHYIECGVTISDTVGTVTVKVDGATVLSLTGQDTNNAVTNVNTLQLGYTSNSGQANINYDDLYVVDSATTLGERRIETTVPSADTATKNWTPNSGTANFSRVNETLVDGDTSYVQASTVGTRDLYSMGALSSTPSVIDAVQVVSFAEKTDATTRTIYNSVQSAGTDSDGSAFSLSASYNRFDRLMETDPNGGGAWTASRVNGLLIGPKVAS